MDTDLTKWGWRDELEEAFESRRDGWSQCLPGRVLSQREDTFTVATSEGIRWAHPAGVMFHKRDTHERPGVGDWVILERVDCTVSESEDTVPVTHSVVDVLPRTACFLREAPGGRGHAQIVATNVDKVFVVNPADDINLNRIERFCVAICGGGAQAGVVLSKGDLVGAQELESARQQVSLLMPNLEVLATSNASTCKELAREALAPVLESGHTYALVGASGVGKSTLVNALMGEMVQETGDVREGDHKGRHVTTFRELFPLKDGALLMDTPGVREFALWSERGGIETVFSDIEELAEQCRFSDCSHAHEPGCAVLAAELSARRLENWRRLTEEMEQNEERRELLKARQQRSDYRRKVKRDRRFSRH